MTTTAPQTTATFVRNNHSCPVCAGSECLDVFEATGIPVHIGICGDSAAEARDMPTGDVTLSYCPSCGFLRNRLFDPDKLFYRPGYEVALHHSPTFRRFMEQVTTRLIKRFELRDRRILEIGCGGAWFLKMLADLGSNDCIGYDPTVPTTGKEQVGQGTVELVRDYFGPQYDVDADFVCCLSVFENIPHPAAFLQNLRRQIGDGNPGIYFEVYNGFHAIHNQETWSINYEQVNWFSRQSLSRAFEQAGFRITEAGECYEGDQYVFVDATPGDPSQPVPPERPDDVILLELMQFAERHRQQLISWNLRLQEYRATHRRVVVWGAGGKGISFLNTLPTSDVIRYVVDINPDKHGTFVPGSAQEIVGPEFLATWQPDTIVLMNALYEDEIRKQVHDLGVDCEFLIA